MNPQDDSIFRVIVAGAETLDVSYALPASQVFDEIKGRFPDVRFPSPEHSPTFLAAHNPRPNFLPCVEGITHVERNELAGLRSETSFNRGYKADETGRRAKADDDGVDSNSTNISHEHSARRRDTDEARGGLSDLHSVSRPGEHPLGDVSFPHKPDDVQESPLDSHLQTRRPSRSFNPKISLDSSSAGPRGAVDQG